MFAGDQVATRPQATGTLLLLFPIHSLLLLKRKKERKKQANKKVKQKQKIVKDLKTFMKLQRLFSDQPRFKKMYIRQQFVMYNQRQIRRLDFKNRVEKI